MEQKPHGILMSAPMVKAILEGRKTQTRRAIKGVPCRDHFGRDIMEWSLSGIYEESGAFWMDVQTDVDDNSHDEIKPPHPVGTILYVKETFTLDFLGPRNCIVYRASEPGAKCRWKPSIFMPRSAARIWLEVAGVKVERFCDISEADAAAEGVSTLPEDFYGSSGTALQIAYKRLIESINGPDAWDKFCWAYTFRRIAGQRL